MSEKRFELTEINPSVNPSDTVCFIIDYENPSKSLRNLNDCVDLLNEQQDHISYWKHKVNGLLWILSQFDEEKVKELLKELEDE